MVVLSMGMARTMMDKSFTSGMANMMCQTIISPSTFTTIMESRRSYSTAGWTALKHLLGLRLHWRIQWRSQVQVRNPERTTIISPKSYYVKGVWNESFSLAAIEKTPSLLHSMLNDSLPSVYQLAHPSRFLFYSFAFHSEQGARPPMSCFISTSWVFLAHVPRSLYIVVYASYSSHKSHLGCSAVIYHLRSFSATQLSFTASLPQLLATCWINLWFFSVLS